ncbi:MAG: SDR family NAD(P)-dependent oxidoreductase [Isosphaeraceae bacterium]
MSAETSEHQTALITGAGSGMGRAIAKTLADLGMRVALIGRDRAKLERVRDEIAEAGGSALVEPCDVSDRPAVALMAERVLSELGSIDVLVCNAGINTPDRGLDVLDPAEWDRLIATNLTGAFNLVHVALPSMRERKHGLVIQIASVAGMRASVLGGSAYSASKFGQAALGICLGREQRTHGIKSTVIYPGEVETPILDARPVPVSAERRALILQPEDVAAAVRFLATLPPRAHVPELVMTPAVDDWV